MALRGRLNWYGFLAPINNNYLITVHRRVVRLLRI